MPSDLPSIKLTLSDRLHAQEFSQQQSRAEKAQQVYKNTLAVTAVNTYLQCLGWITSLKTSDSWNYLMQTLLDTADLELPNYGKLECRPVESAHNVMVIPEEVTQKRVAYIAVSIEESQNSARILGFTTETTALTVPLDRLRAIAELPEYLEQYHHNLIHQNQALPKLSSWLLGGVEAGWQKWETFLATQPNLAFLDSSQGKFCFRSFASQVSSETNVSRETLTTGISRVKLWNLGNPDNYIEIALVISLSSVKLSELEVSVKVCPTNEHNYLPSGLLIQILDETQQPVLQAHTKSTNEAIEFFLSGEIGEFFSIQAVFDDAVKTESFMI